MFFECVKIETDVRVQNFVPPLFFPTGFSLVPLIYHKSMGQIINIWCFRFYNSDNVYLRAPIMGQRDNPLFLEPLVWLDQIWYISIAFFLASFPFSDSFTDHFLFAIKCFLTLIFRYIVLSK